MSRIKWKKHLENWQVARKPREQAPDFSRPSQRILKPHVVRKESLSARMWYYFKGKIKRNTSKRKWYQKVLAQRRVNSRIISKFEVGYRCSGLDYWCHQDLGSQSWCQAVSSFGKGEHQDLVNCSIDWVVIITNQRIAYKINTCPCCKYWI